MVCTKCNYENESVAKFCSNCGQNLIEVQNEKVETKPILPDANVKKEMNIFAIVGFVVACSSLFINLFGLTAIAAAILSVIGLVQITRSNERGKGFAIAGIVIGAIVTLFTVLLFFYFLFLTFSY